MSASSSTTATETREQRIETILRSSFGPRSMRPFAHLVERAVDVPEAKGVRSHRTGFAMWGSSWSTRVRQASVASRKKGTSGAV